jgi:Cd2+/Zn2+-exporting ATPase
MSDRTITKSKENVKKISTFLVDDLDCPDCAAKIERGVTSIPGVHEVKLDFMKGRLTVAFDDEPDPRAVERKVKSLGHGITSAEKPPPRSVNRVQLVLTIISGIFTASGMVTQQLHGAEWMTITLFLIAMFSGGFHIARKGLMALRHLALDMNFLMTVAVIGAAAIGAWNEGAVVIFLFSVAHLLEAYSLDRARNSIRKLMDLSPKLALVRRNGQEISIPVEDVQLGDTIIIKPGGSIPLDGVIIVGNSSVDQAAITGESMPVDKQPGDEVFAGTLNHQGALEVTATRLSDDTELAKIIHLVEEAQSQRAPSQQFVDRFAKYYTPLVVGGAVLVAVLPPALFSASFTVWFYRALVMLVIACPCALVISTPVTIVSGLARAAWGNVLIKGGVYLEGIGQVKCIALDKTGTLTTGQPVVAEIVTLNGTEKAQLLSIAGALESRSEHPLAAAILKYISNKGIQEAQLENFESLPGKGVKGRIDGTEYYLGSHGMFEALGICDEKVHDALASIENSHQTAILVGKREYLLGIFAITDDIREGAQKVIGALKENGVAHTVMLTGDNARTAQAIGQKLGIDEIRANLLPEDKVRILKELREKYRTVAMVGDGVNDAPALAVATMGIAMGTAGTDAALETADIALMADDLTRLPFIVNLSRHTVRIIKQNIVLAITIKAVFLALAIPGYATLWMAVFADMGASLLVIFNGLRMLKK